MSDSKTSTIVGIDLGTTNSLVAVVDEQGPRVLGDDSAQVMPSVVRIEPDGSFVVGQAAADRLVELPERTINSVKRLMGRSLSDAQSDLAYLGYEVVEGEHHTARVRVTTDAGPRVYSPQELSAAILRELRKRAETALGKPVEKAVVTVPAYFDDAQRQATRDAGRLAGIEVVRIVNEPTAAALAYGIGTRAGGQPQTIAVYDLGGGTFDISILRLVPAESEGDTDFFQVLSTAGDTHLGGDDVDHMLVKLFTAEIAQQLGLSEAQPMDSFDASTRRALVGFAQAVKHKLSEDDAAQIAIDLGNGNQYARTVTRDEFEGMIEAWVQRSLDACKRALRDARKANGNEPVEIDAVVMVGGSTRIPMVRQRVGEFFNTEPYTALDPDRVVALGAAMQASIISGARSGQGSSSLLVDVIPLSLGIETAGGAMAKLIMRNSSVPARAVERFSTSVDGQVNVKIHVVQGEREMVEDCRSLGVFDLRGIPPMPAGVPKLVVEFLVDANGVLSVSAIEERSGKRARIQIVPNHGLSRDEVDRIEQESFTHAREDMNRHRVVDLITNSKLDIKWISERFERYGDLLNPDEHATLEHALDELRGYVSRGEQDWTSVDPNAFYAAKDALDRASVRLQEIGITQSLRDDADEAGT
ncbi:MAG: Fe-S protein assembly chaperone HscA [Phycisphaerales bacterium]|nr:Fe-S protein assembly chaperone HscA [Phycisphaerales bacterium]